MMSRYYPGFFAALSIILLRVAIGWHFLYEGWEKLESTTSGKEPFSAEIYLRNAAGPLATYFRGMIPDVNGLALLDPPRLKAAWSDEVTRIADQFHFTQEQRLQAQKILEDNQQWAEYWFHDPENDEKRQKYYHDLAKVQQVESDPGAIAFQRERASEARRGVDADRRALTAPLIERENGLRGAVVKLATADQIMSAGAASPPWTYLDYINRLTVFGLIAIGVCLMAGFMTPWAALGAAVFLAMIYLSMPPWPGVPPNPKAEGHYWIVSKNLVELLACLVIATTPSGHWVGFDALFFGARRRRLARAAAEGQGGGDARGRRRQPVRIT
ncbi:MAG: DoxX family protein [Isosphaeraceae bacterium]